MHGRFPLGLRNGEDLLFERGIDICRETIRLWWNRFCPLFAGDIRRQRVNRMRGFGQWRWHLDEMYVKLNGEMVYRRSFRHLAYVDRVSPEQERWAEALAVEQRHGANGPRVIAERIGELAFNGDWDGVERWREIAVRYDRLSRG